MAIASIVLASQLTLATRRSTVGSIGSGGPYAHAAAKALTEFSDLDARTIAEEAMKIAASICIFTNERITVEEL